MTLVQRFVTYALLPEECPLALSQYRMAAILTTTQKGGMGWEKYEPIYR